MNQTDFQNTLCPTAQSWQKADWQAMQPAWTSLVNETETTIRRAYIERPRGHSKTTDITIAAAWPLITSTKPIRGIAAAADQDQAGLIIDALQRLKANHVDLFKTIKLTRTGARNTETGSELQLISSDVGSSYGILPDFIICDELTHWPDGRGEDMWYSLISAAAKKPRCIITVQTNAGVGRGWQFEIRQHARTSDRWHFSSLNGPQAPWITAESLNEQKAILPPAIYNRLWLNQWQHSDGDFVSLAEADSCIDVNGSMQGHSVRGRSYVAALDFGSRRDNSVGVLCHRDGNTIIVDRMDVGTPTPDRPIPTSWAKHWFEQVQLNYEDVTFIVDPWQMQTCIEELSRTARVKPIEFAGSQYNHRLAMCLRQLIIERRITYYNHCGSIPGPHRNDLSTELASLLLHQSGPGWLRIDHKANGHDDRAFALGAAALELIENQPILPTWSATPPNRDGGFASF